VDYHFIKYNKNKMMGVTACLSITMKINDLKYIIKRHRLGDWFKNQNPKSPKLKQKHLTGRENAILK
jgi:hypothetical protein